MANGRKKSAKHQPRAPRRRNCPKCGDGTLSDDPVYVPAEAEKPDRLAFHCETCGFPDLRPCHDSPDFDPGGGTGGGGTGG